MPFNDYPLQSITVPGDASDTDPRIFIGDDDPTLVTLGQTNGIVFYFGEQRAFLISVEAVGPPGTPDDIGRLHIWAFCGFPAELHEVVNLDFDIPGNSVNWQFNADSPSAGMLKTLSLAGNVVGLGGSTEPASTDPAFSDVYLFGDSMARGAKSFGSATASSAAIAAETVVLTTSAAFTFRAGRAYRAELHGMISAGTAGARATFRLRKGTTVAGAGLSFTGDVACPAVGPNYNGDGYAYFQVNATDVTTQMCFTLVGTGGTITQFGSANTPRYMTIFDVGESSDFPNAPVLS